jgi:nucleotide-binding universal stress UspA family protein
MFKNILVPTDGSELALRGAHLAIGLAKSLGARVTAFHAAPDYQSGTYAGYAMEGAYFSEDLGKRLEENARAYLLAVERDCQAEDVPCKTVFTLSVRVSESIVKAAHEHDCDLIVMTSHGHTGLVGVLLGSETQRVLAHSPVPVLVVR